jgi:opacity protein-like surface antigen
VLAVAASAPGESGAEERLLVAGLWDLTLLTAGYSTSHEQEGVPGVDGVQAIPHLGFVLTEEHGPGWLRGNLEVLAEPALIHVRNDESRSSTAAGLTAMGRWILAATPRLRPYVEAGAGVLGGRIDLPQMSCEVSFVLQGGAGALVFVADATAISLGYRFQHISNAGACRDNLGLNSSVFIFGISYFFP